jgi:hypothetical protein
MARINRSLSHPHGGFIGRSGQIPIDLYRLMQKPSVLEELKKAL